VLLATCYILTVSSCEQCWTETWGASLLVARSVCMYVGMLPSSRASWIHLSEEAGHAETRWKVTCKVQPSMCPGCSHPTNQSRGLLRFLPV
jgi:hypothetical protein